MLDKGCKLKAEIFSLKVADGFVRDRMWEGIVVPWLSKFECGIKADDKSALIPKKPVEFADTVLLNARIAVYAIQLFLRAAILILTRRTRRVNFIFARTFIKVLYVFISTAEVYAFMENLSVQLSIGI